MPSIFRFLDILFFTGVSFPVDACLVILLLFLRILEEYSDGKIILRNFNTNVYSPWLSFLQFSFLLFFFFNPKMRFCSIFFSLVKSIRSDLQYFKGGIKIWLDGKMFFCLYFLALLENYKSCWTLSRIRIREKHFWRKRRGYFRYTFTFSPTNSWLINTITGLNVCFPGRDFIRQQDSRPKWSGINPRDSL